MSDRCLEPDDLAAVLDAPANDPRQQHLERCPRCRALVGAWREFVARLLAEHYDPAYRRSSQRNFARLAEARAVRIAAADEAVFADAARSLAARGELQPA